MITPKQCKMARAALGWGVRDLAAHASIDKATISRFERESDVYISTVEKLEKALLATGKIKFEGKCVCYVE